MIWVGRLVLAIGCLLSVTVIRLFFNGNYINKNSGDVFLFFLSIIGIIAIGVYLIRRAKGGKLDTFAKYILQYILFYILFKLFGLIIASICALVWIVYEWRNYEGNAKKTKTTQTTKTSTEDANQGQEYNLFENLSSLSNSSKKMFWIIAAVLVFISLIGYLLTSGSKIVTPNDSKSNFSSNINSSNQDDIPTYNIKKEISIVAPKEEKPFVLLISKSNIAGLTITTQTTIKDIINVFGKENVEIGYTKPEGTPVPTVFIYRTGFGNKPSIEGYIKKDGEDYKLQFGLAVKDPRFVTDKNIHVGSTVGELKEKYFVDEIRTGEFTKVAISKKERLSFFLKGMYGKLKSSNINDVPNDTLIEEILVWPASNVN